MTPVLDTEARIAPLEHTMDTTVSELLLVAVLFAVVVLSGRV
ncbi:hypothetical protein [Cyanobium sp. Alchichica 3B3-8F6]|nr:hypothetical protein [Cyanobium sp. Alchichica 3B3-8F6]